MSDQKSNGTDDLTLGFARGDRDTDALVVYRGKKCVMRCDKRRVIAALNACSDLSTEALEAGAVSDLLVACKAVAEWVYAFPKSNHPYDAWVMLKDAIAKAEGRTDD